MKTDQELEQLMRATFIGRAQTITRGPAWTEAPLVDARRRSRPWIAALAAAAAIVALVAGVTIVRDRKTNEPATSITPTPTRPAPTSPAPTSPAPTSPPPTTTHAVVPAVATTCVTTLPQAWKSALRNSVVDSGSPTPNTASTQVLSASSSGIVALRDDGPIPGYARSVVLLRAGHSPKTLYSVPQPDTYNVTSADITGKWLVLGIWVQARQPKHTVGGNTPDVIEAVVAVDMNSGHSHVIVAASDYLKKLTGQGRAIVNDAVQDGKVYWTERSSYAATKGTVKSYNLATGTVSTVATGVDGSSYVIAAPEGVVFDIQGQLTMLAPASLPAQVQSALSDFGRAHLGTDGTSYAWAVDASTIGFWRPGMSAPTYAKLAGGFDTDDSGGTPTVAGEYVVTLPGNDSAELTDMVAKVSAPMVNSDFPHGRGQLYDGANGVFAGSANSGIASHYVNDYWLDSPSLVIRLDTTSLPKLTC